MSDVPNKDQSGDPFIAVYRVHAESFEPDPGDIAIIVTGSNTIHLLHGPYPPEELEDVMELWANQHLPSGSQFDFYYQPPDGGPPVTGESQLWEVSHLN